MNEQNLIPTTERTKDEVREITTKGGINSGKARRKKADMRKAVQSMLDNTYSDSSGKELSGAEVMALKLFKIANGMFGMIQITKTNIYPYILDENYVCLNFIAWSDISQLCCIYNIGRTADKGPERETKKPINQQILRFI